MNWKSVLQRLPAKNKIAPFRWNQIKKQTMFDIKDLESVKNGLIAPPQSTRFVLGNSTQLHAHAIGNFHAGLGRKTDRFYATNSV
jgi:hypothetical protein